MAAHAPAAVAGRRQPEAGLRLQKRCATIARGAEKIYEIPTTTVAR
jgi:hypothetical protein